MLVDMRLAPTRNDVAFESAMAALRAALTQHFKRVAVLLESSLGELQVARLGRDERHGTFARPCSMIASWCGTVRRLAFRTTSAYRRGAVKTMRSWSAP